jgi:transposase
MSVRFKRKFTEEERVAIVNEVLETGSNSLIAAKYDINQVQLSTWKCNYRRYQQTIKPKETIETELIPNYKKEYKKAVKTIQDKDLEIAILRDLIKKKNLL